MRSRGEYALSDHPRRLERLFLQSFVEFPPQQASASFNLEQMMRAGYSDGLASRLGPNRGAGQALAQIPFVFLGLRQGAAIQLHGCRPLWQPSVR
jgi:hypothetical protein